MKLQPIPCCKNCKHCWYPFMGDSTCYNPLFENKGVVRSSLTGKIYRYNYGRNCLDMLYGRPGQLSTAHCRNNKLFEVSLKVAFFYHIYNFILSFFAKECECVGLKDKDIITCTKCNGKRWVFKWRK